MKILPKLSAVKTSKGQSIVEISLITPLLLVALCIPMDFGIAFFVANITGTAARDAARIGSDSANRQETRAIETSPRQMPISSETRLCRAYPHI